MKELKIEIPQGYEIDKEKSTFECIKFKKKKEIKTWDDLCECSKSSNEVRVSGYRIDYYSDIYVANKLIARDYSKNVFLTEKEAKSALAMAQISQLMPYYGGAITDEEWINKTMYKYVIERINGEICKGLSVTAYCYIAFHTIEQREEFYNNNLSLVKEYFMID